MIYRVLRATLSQGAEHGTNSDTGSADFNRINRNTTGQSNFQRFIQLGFRLTF